MPGHGSHENRGSAGASPPEVGPPSARVNKWLVLALVAVGSFMNMLDASIVNISLPAIGRALNDGMGGPIEWVLIGYLVTVAATLPTCGRLSDVYGRKPVWVAGLVIFTLSSALCGAAPSLPLLLVARAFHGVGAALLLAPIFAIIS